MMMWGVVEIIRPWGSISSFCERFSAPSEQKGLSGSETLPPEILPWAQLYKTQGTAGHQGVNKMKGGRVAPLYMVGFWSMRVVVALQRDTRG
jgi:hypothetical protein